MKKLFLALILSSPAWPASADYDEGLLAYQKGDFDKAYSEWLAVAMSPSETVLPALMAETCYALGMLFWVGQGVEQNTATSAHWLLRAADLGHPGAQTKLGYLYGAGLGVQQSDFEALKWTQMAANQGDVDAQYNLGVFYRDGQGVSADTEQALKWFREAASNGDQVSADVVSNYEKYGWPAPVIEPQAESIPVEIVDAQEAKEPVGGLVAGPVAEPVEEPAARPVVEPVELEVVEHSLDEEWILQRNPQHYTIQVIALLAPENMQAFINTNPDWAPFAIYHQKWKGKPLFVLLQGDYANVEEARAAVAQFPAGIQKQSELWVRKFLMVQELL